MAAHERARDYRRAAEMLDETLTKIDLIGPRRIEYEGPRDGQIDEHFAWKATVDQLIDGDLFEVAVEVYWSTPTGQRSVQARTLINDAIESRNPLLTWDDL